MLYSTLLVAATSLAGLASAQFNYSTSGPLSIDVSQVPFVTKESWCLAQTNSCPQICGGEASPNSCNSTSLAYMCSCSNGAHPNISAYGETVPSFICQTWVANCVDGNANDLAGITACRSVQCGMKNASAVGSSSSSGSGSGSSSASAASSPTGTGSASTTSSSSSASPSASGNAAMHLVMNYGTGIFATGLLAAFGFVL